MATVKPLILYPFQFATANRALRIFSGTNQTVTVTLTADTDYWVSGDGDTRSGHGDLVERLQTALNTNTDGATFTCTLSDAGLITITADVNFTIFWNHSATTLDPSIFGWETGKVASSGMSATSDQMVKGWWFPDKNIHTDSRPELNMVSRYDESLAGYSRSYSLGSFDTRRFRIENVRENKILQDYAETDKPYNSLEYAWIDGRVFAGAPFRYYPDYTSRLSSAYGYYRSVGRGKPWELQNVNRLHRYTVNFETRELTAQGANEIPYVSEYAAHFDPAENASATITTYDGLAAATWSLWVNVDTDPGNMWQKNGTNDTFRIYYTYSAQSLGFELTHGDGSTNSSDTTPNSTLTAAGGWHHCVIVYNGSAQTVTAYINGTSYALTSTPNWPTAINSLSEPTYFGGSGLLWTGDIDEAAFWPFALSPTQVAEVYNGGDPPNLNSLSFTAPTHWWKFEQNLNDSNGSAHLSVGLGAPSYITSTPSND